MTKLVALVMLALGSRSAFAQEPSPEPPPIEPPPIEPPAPPPPIEIAPPPAPRLVVPPAPFPVTEQPPAPPPAPVHRSICIEGRPLRCDSVFLFEAGVRFGTHTTSTIDLGVLVHQGPRSAWGMTIGYLATQARPETTGQAAIVSKSGMYQARYRRYLGGQGGALDLGIGTGRYGVSGEVSLGIRDIIAVTGGVNTFQFEGGRDVAANVGVRLGTEGIAYLLYALISLAPR